MASEWGATKKKDTCLDVVTADVAALRLFLLKTKIFIFKKEKEEERKERKRKEGSSASH